MVRSTLLPLAVLVAAATPALAADPVKLTKEETQQALSGKSMTYGGKSGRPVVTFFAAGGNLTLRSGNAQPSTGTWQVEDDGRFCIKIVSGTARDVCRRLVRTDTGIEMSDAKGLNITPIDGLD